ncbi:hypothetical protein LUU34_01161100 [Aix galericulata]|nr:hypothetical protein LUU34_01161100 [Aix galericulata]
MPSLVVHPGKDAYGFYPGQVGRVHQAHTSRGAPGPFSKLQPAPVNYRAETPFQPDFDNAALRKYVHCQKIVRKPASDWYNQTSYKAAFDLPYFSAGFSVVEVPPPLTPNPETADNTNIFTTITSGINSGPSLVPLLLPKAGFRTGLQFSSCCQHFCEQFQQELPPGFQRSPQAEVTCQGCSKRVGAACDSLMRQAHPADLSPHQYASLARCRPLQGPQAHPELQLDATSSNVQLEMAGLATKLKPEITSWLCPFLDSTELGGKE